jgi:hypothetical protein
MIKGRWAAKKLPIGKYAARSGRSTDNSRKYNASSACTGEATMVTNPEQESCANNRR